MTTYSRQEPPGPAVPDQLEPHGRWPWQSSAGARRTYDVAEIVQLPTRKRRQPFRPLLSGLLLCLLVLALIYVVRDNRFQWHMIQHYLFGPTILRGVLTTLWLTALVMLISTPLSVVVALMRVSRSRTASSFAWTFVWFFRSVPQLVQLILFFNIGALFPKLSFGIPFGPTFVSAQANQIVTPLFAAVVGLTLAEVAYMSEIIRGSIMAVGHGQVEAGRTLGLSPWHVMTRIILPQAARVAVPAAAGQLVTLVKMTSLVSVISMTDLLYSAELIYVNNFATIPLLLVATIWYLVITSILGIGQYLLERRFGRGYQMAVAVAVAEAEGGR